MVAAALILRGRRALGALLAASTLAGIVDEAQNGPRVAAAPGAPPAHDRQRGRARRRRATAAGTLVVLAHHDAPQTGMLFDQTLQRRLYERAPQLIERFKTPLPQWWLGLAGPLATLLARAPRPPRAPRAPGCSRRRCSARALRRRRVAQPDGARRERQPLRRRRAGRPRRAAARAPGAGPARAAGLLWRRGDAPGRHARVHRAPPPRARPGRTWFVEPRHRRLAAPGDAGGRGAGVDGELRGPLAARSARRRAPSGSASRCSAASARAPRPTA